MKTRCYLLLAIVLYGCGPGEPMAPQVTAIEIIQHTTRDTWQVEYRFRQPVRQVQFPRNAVLFRNAYWQLHDPDLEFIRIPGTDPQGKPSGDHAPYEGIRHRHGKTFTGFSVTVPAIYEVWPREYPQNYAFTDGSILLYTGHLVVEADQDDSAAHTLLVVPHVGQHIVVRGKRFAGETAITDPGDDGLFIYFGNIESLEQDNFAAVIDPGLPHWLRQTLARSLPPVMDYYHQRFNQPLPRKLSVYFSFAPDETEHLHFKGGALGDATFSLSVVGEGWQEPPADLRAAIPLHIAHEAAHLWNLHLGSGERAGAWMHEGNANVLAWLALRETGYLSEDEFSTLVCAAESACLNQLGSSTLASQETAGASSVSYDCGAVVAHATDRAMRASGNGDLFDFTNALIARLDSRPGTNRHYFDQLYAMTGTNLVAQHDNNFAVRADDLAALQTCSD